jgi:hypothetical protein
MQCPRALEYLLCLTLLLLLLLLLLLCISRFGFAAVW